MVALLDTSIFVAASFPRDRNHTEAKAALRGLRTDRIVTGPTLPEMF
jgi:predicted nucleic acid-binding protein